jgi:hypothetical protein
VAGTIAETLAVGIESETACVLEALSADATIIEGTRDVACRLARDKVLTADEVDVTSVLGQQGISAFGVPSWQVAAARTAAGSNSTEDIIK